MTTRSVATVARLARPHPKGVVIERAAILAQGEVSRALLTWIVDHGGEPEAATATSAPGGLHGGRGEAAVDALRYVLPRSAIA